MTGRLTMSVKTEEHDLQAYDCFKRRLTAY
jgi:hypothetical protein